MSKKKKKPAGVLAALLVVSVALWSFWGMHLKRRFGKISDSYRDKPAVAVPFLVLRGGDGMDWMWELQDRKPEPDTTEPNLEESLPVSTPPATQATEPMGPLAVYGEDEHYFDDALFIGDSRMEALAQYERLGNADYFASVGLSVFRLFSEKASDANFAKTDLEGLLQSKAYGKVYMMLGLNEAGYPLDVLTKVYGACVEQIRSLQPKAKIFLIQVYGVSKEQADCVSYLAPENLQKINEMIAGLCDGTQVFCLDPRGLYEDGEGFLREELSSDGVHPYITSLPQFVEWLCEQAI